MKDLYPHPSKMQESFRDLALQDIFGISNAPALKIWAQTNSEFLGASYFADELRTAYLERMKVLEGHKQEPLAQRTMGE